MNAAVKKTNPRTIAKSLSDSSFSSIGVVGGSDFGLYRAGILSPCGDFCSTVALFFMIDASFSLPALPIFR